MAGLRPRETKPIPTDLIEQVVMEGIKEASVNKGVPGDPAPREEPPVQQKPTPEPAAKTPEPEAKPRPAEETPIVGTQEEGESNRSQERIQALVAERKQRDKDVKVLQQEVAELREKTAEADRAKAMEEALAEENLPVDYYDWSEPRRFAYVAKAMNGASAAPSKSRDPEVQKLLLREEIMMNDPDLTNVQAAAVVEIAEATKLPLDRAMTLARSERSELFGSAGEPTEALPASQSSQRPRGSAAPPPKPDTMRDARGRFVEGVKSRQKTAVHQAGTELVKSLIFGGGSSP